MILLAVLTMEGRSEAASLDRMIVAILWATVGTVIGEAIACDKASV